MDIDSIKNLQKELSELIGVSGYEDEVSSFIIDKIENKVDKAWIDPLGNVLAIKEGNNKQNRILFDAHTDEIGFMISHIDKKGFLRFVLIGGWDTRTLLGQSIIIKANDGTRFHGIIGSKPPHMTTAKEREKTVSVSEMYIDAGFSSYDDVLSHGIDIGTTGTLYDPFVDFPNGMVRGKAFDDRTGCNVLIQTLFLIEERGELEDTVLFNFAVQEEIGARGAKTGAFSLKPTVALAIENTTAADVPGTREEQLVTSIGRGPAITIADHRCISRPKVNRRLMENARLEKIPFQLKKPLYGGTDASVIHVSRQGVPSSVVSVPCRYIHSPTSLLKLTDIYETIRLVDAFIRNPAKIKV